MGEDQHAARRPVAMYDVEKLIRFASLMRPLEEEHPILSLWRIQKDGGRCVSRARGIKSILRRVKNAPYRALRSQSPRNGQVVFYASSNTPSTIGTILPLIVEFCRRGVAPFVLTNRETAILKVNGFRADFADFRHWVARTSRGDRKVLRNESRILAKEVERIFGPEYDDDFVTHLEVAMAMRIAAANFMRGASALVLENDYFPINKGLVLGARDIGIPVVILQHGFFGLHQFPMNCDVFLAWGEFFKNEATRYGMDGSTIRITGCPRWDEIQRFKDREYDERIRKKLGGFDHRPLVLLLSTAHAAACYPTVFSEYFKSVRWLIESGIEVAVKLHPAERDLGAYLRDIPQSVVERMTVVPGSMSLYDAIRHSDVIYNVMSTAAIEAMLFGKPVLFPDGPDRSRLTDFPDHGGGKWCAESQIVEDCTEYGSPGVARDVMLAKQNVFLEVAVANRCCATLKTADAIEKVIEEGIGE